MNSQAVIRCRPLLGTFVHIRAEGPFGPEVMHGWVSEAFDAIAAIERLMSFQNTRSELALLNSCAHLSPIAVHEWTRRVFEFSCELGERSGGLFDLAVRTGGGGSYRDIILNVDGTIAYRRPLKVDLGGVAKGFAVDVAIQLLAARRVSSACVNAGGDLRFHGERPRTIALRDPLGPHGAVLELPLPLSSAATSAPYFRRGMDHLIAARGAAANGANLESVTVFAESCMVADALTKVVWFGDEVNSRAVLDFYQAQAYVLKAQYA